MPAAVPQRRSLSPERSPPAARPGRAGPAAREGRRGSAAGARGPSERLPQAALPGPDPQPECFARLFAPRLSQSATNKGREPSTLCLVKDLTRMERHGEGLRTRCAFINKVLRKKVQNKAVPLRVITSVAGPCPRIIQRNLKILLTQLNSKIKKKLKFGEFSKFPFPSMSRFPYRDRPVAGSGARPRPAERGPRPPHTSDKEQPAERPLKAPLKAAPVPGKPSPAGEQPRPGPSRGELLDPGGLRSWFKRPHGGHRSVSRRASSRSPVLSVPSKTRHPAAQAQSQLPWWVPSCPACGRVRRRLQRFPYIQGCPGPAAGKRAERGILLPGSLLRAGCFALLKVPGLGKCFPFHSWPERLPPRR